MQLSEKRDFSRSLNLLMLVLVSTALLCAFYFQLRFFDLPCPLCLLQRAALLLTGTGLLFNLCYGNKKLHYGMVILGALAVAAVATRHIFLHIVPGDKGYGLPFLGLHLYTWSFILSVVIIIGVAITLMITPETATPAAAKKTFIQHIIVAIFALLMVGNLLSTVLECGGGQCDDNPTFYQLLK
ncbi:disulfide bond formation protein B [Erwinia psidii]|uniref:Disulfide bond formation protein B n=1 Tax=Erwinia psidii TaxID=69224 RepID=A0A3N6UKY8_9GAMM|nr:disulfide bond formation protein B [Erwinia psidii]MCX8958745.1 disulfide bond formation protein B [Erwinia psidii]MCX8963025.1 disulfide bond formation protein B [Erwinia psidii]MCX8967359.1 disulfide bond formation protein B [Erwinia psidii]RQM36599.1 disulfide bond formation protein B [Erwinia psidii]